MNEHGGHIYYPAFLGNSPVTADDVNTVIAYAGHRPYILNNPSMVAVAVVDAKIISEMHLSRIQQQGRA